MKLFRLSVLGAAALCASCAAALAQFEVELTLDSANYMRYEPITAHVKVSNFSGHTIGLFNHNEKPWLSFYVSRQNGQQVDDLGVEYDLQQAQIKGGDSMVVHVNLTPVYNIRAPGIYRVMAIVNSATHNREFKSPVRQFDLSTGRVLWQETVAVHLTNAPAVTPTTTNEPPVNLAKEDLRTYVLVANRVQRGEKLYARVESEENNLVYGVVQLGILVGFGKPEAMVDRQSHLHVLHQVGSRSFSYIELTPSAKFAKQKVYSNIKSRPELKIDDQGKVNVTGGELTYPNPAVQLPEEEITTDTPPLKE